ncbi:hypothetical protein [Planotetraspora kaengkrachanensis]|uniref:hypothetical protein n=1 Tax=Planotetraspora kaengkrachanensis TaxID=575193 RepID=UPI001940FD01|nr:hypothetical protein [Planotetraspora kaengkrachanensis]
MDLRNTRPSPRASPSETASALLGYLFGRRAELIDPTTDGTPVCLGNYTDMLMTPRNREATVEYLEQIVGILPSMRPVILITKSSVPSDLVEALDALEWPILWFFSQSFARDARIPLEAGPVASFATTLANARMISGTRNQRAIHFWRPFVTELSNGVHDEELTVNRLKESGMSCSVVVGPKLGPGVPVDDPRIVTHIPSGMKAAGNSDEVFDHAGWRRLAKISRNVQYPLYRHTSCAIALNLGIKEYLGTWRPAMSPSRCLPCSCPRTQRSRCAPTTEDQNGSHWRARISSFLGLSDELVTRDPQTGYLHVGADVSEFDYNTILHATKGLQEVIFHSIVAQKAWPGPW